MERTMNLRRATRAGSSLTALFVIGACGGAEPRDPGSPSETGQAVLAITQVPSDVSCVQVTVAGSRTVVRKFDVAPGSSSIMTLSGLPTGNVTFSEDAFDAACSAVGASSVPTWVSEQVPAVLTPGAVTQVAIALRHNGQAIVTTDFIGDDAGAAGAPGTGGATGAGGATASGGATGTGGSTVCVPIPFATACGSKECGTASNGCGSSYSCGSCSDPCLPLCSGGFCTPFSACLVAGTPITMADRTVRPIEDVRTGDQVLAYDVTTGTVRPQRVSQTFRHAASENHEGLVLINGKLRATGNHPVYANGRFVRADSLGEGDTLVQLGARGPALDSAIQTLEMLPGEVETFNLEVEGDHDYFADGVLVHNKPLPCP